LGGESLILPLVIPLVAASLTGLLARRVGLSIVAGYVAGGIIVRPILRLVDPSSDILSFLSELGIILIAFEIGLTLRLDFFSRMVCPLGMGQNRKGSLKGENRRVHHKNI
jgi:Kef-type K+ transport system membrane component KefB